ncbi:Oxoglutarate iron-dependent oxygenase isoform B [Chlorella sorokiniana]|uniref:Oxoglutarate iron-dependent oxygenase isoform B n=1 Tax=Chlorella sorokiniana TaxID=3076 RepID=A0A2P6TRU1_CHLSO|nr:Oxoglutarate iron-dependent oxygenase isoform B [Chlorella sorokiniana]|eukprot:PRW56775.1 Oxoglutarate iron-dependent oxygenase isoform B [Chlorella sorokiniana]
MEGAGPSSLMELAEDEIIDELIFGYRQLQSPFCVGGSLGRIPVRLAVAGGGGGGDAGGSGSSAAQTVELPAGGEDALESLLAACQPAVFGKGKETVRDDSYRSALALKGSRLYTQDFEAAHLSGVLAAVGRLLLPDAGPLSARLHALGAYKTGGFFKAHRDTPRGDPGFVGSLVVCLPVAHRGGALRVEHGGQAVEYELGAGAVLPVTEGTRVALAYELFARPETSSGPPEPLRALTGGAESLLLQLKSALDNNSFMVNGGKLGFPCQAVRALLKGTDAVVLHVLSALGVPATIVRVWEEEDAALEMYDFESEREWQRAESGRVLLVSPVPGKPLHLSKAAGERPPRRPEGEWEQEVLAKHAGAKMDFDIDWLGGRNAFPEWTLGAMAQFWGNEGMYTTEFYCSLGIVADIPAFADRPSISERSLAWAGRQSAAAPAAPAVAFAPVAAAGKGKKKKAKAGRGAK